MIGPFINFTKNCSQFEDMYDQTTIQNFTLKNPKEKLRRGYEISYHEIKEANPAAFGLLIKFKRRQSEFVVEYYLPCGILVYIASISFLIEPSMVPGRCGLLVMLFLVFTNFLSNSKARKLYVYFEKFEKKATI